MRVESYSIGFPPKLFSFRYGETEYMISAIPLGGYVKISGMIDESMDTDHLKSEPQPWEFRAKPAWQRLLVMLGGIIFNVILGLGIFIALAFANGENYYTLEEVNKHGIYAGELGEMIGFRTGDRVVGMNGKPIQKFNDVYNPEFLLEEGNTYNLRRDGKPVDAVITNEFIGEFSGSDGKKAFINMREPFTIGKLSEGLPAQQAGMQVGDRMVKIDETEINYYDQLAPALSDKAGKEVNVLIERDGNEKLLQITLTENGKMGFHASSTLKMEHRDYTITEAFKAGTLRAVSPVLLTVKSFGKMFSGDIDPSKAISGPIGIASQFPPYFSLGFVIVMTGMLSMILAFMNLLPIPALDGGHVIFLTYEIIAGRPPADKFLEHAQRVGMIFLLLLMVLIIGNDFIKHIINNIF